MHALPRLVVAATPALAAVLVLRGADEAFAVGQATVLWLGALVALGCGLVVVARRGRRPRATPWLSALAAAYALALVAAAVESATPWLAVWGRAGRHTGLATALAALGLAAVAAWAFRDRPAVELRAMLLLAALPVVGYGLVQAAGADPLRWELVEGGPAVFSTLGNATFLSAWTGMVAPLALWAVLDAGARSWLRAGAALLLAACSVLAWSSGSVQGLAAGAVGVGCVLLGWWSAEQRPLAGRLAVLLAGALAAVVALARADALRTEVTASLDSRLEHWATAWTMATDHPLRGVGLEGFAAWFRRYEPTSLAVERGLDRSLDSPHNVALQALAEGGWPLACTWGALVVVTAVALVRGWQRTQGQRRLALAAVAGVWLAYLTQAMVSIDVAPLAALGAAAAGATLGLGAPEWLASAPLSPMRARIAAVGVLVGLLVPAAVASTLPLRADLAAGAARHADADGEQDTAAGLYARARALAPWEPRYAALDGARRTRAGDSAGALAAYEAARRADPDAVGVRLTLARLAVATGEDARARSDYAHAVKVAPRTPQVLAEAGGFALRRGRVDQARDLLERALIAGDGQPAWWRDLADARSATGDDAGAAEARRRADTLEGEG